MPKVEFIAIDGDDVGSVLRSHIIANDIEGTAKLSLAITEYFLEIKAVLESNGYEVVFCGGDSILAVSSQEVQADMITGFPLGVCTISIGLGETAEYAYLALQLAKARGKNRAVRIRNTVATTILSHT